jgi:YD repeat-containing protein
MDPDSLFTINTENNTYEQTCKDGSEYIYNIYGNLVRYETRNGLRINLEYDRSGYYVKEIQFERKTGSGYIKEFLITCEYKPSGEGRLLLDTIKMSNGSEISYQYSGKYLNKVTVTGEGGKGKKVYSYTYTSGKLTDITDASEKNAYAIHYTDNKVSECIYPDTTKLCFGYDEAGKKSTYSKKTSDGRIIYEGMGNYNDDGRFTLMKDGSEVIEYGSLYTYSYNNNLLAGSNKTITYNKLVNDKIEQCVDLAGDIFEYERNGNVTKEIYDNGVTIIYTYEDKRDVNKNNPTEILIEYKDKDTGKTDKLMHLLISYDEKGNALTVTDVINNQSAELEYDKSGNVTSETSLTDEKTRTSTTYQYDNLGNVVEEKTNSGSLETDTKYEYDRMGRVLTEESLSDVSLINHEYDSFGREIKEIEKHGEKELVTRKYYDANDNLIKEITPSGIETEYSYDSMNRMISEKEKADNNTITTSTTYKYTEAQIRMGNNTPTRKYDCLMCVTTKDNNGRLISATYSDELGHVVREQSQGICTDYRYDNQGNIVSSYVYGENDAEGILNAYSYDVNGNVTARLENAGTNSRGELYVGRDTIVSKTQYDGVGNVLSSIDPLGNITSYRYTRDKKLSAVVLPGDNNLSRQYEYSDRLENGYYADTITDIKGNRSETVSNAADQIMYTADHGENSSETIKTEFQYDKQGNVIKQTNGNGTYIKWEYDSDGNCIREKTYNKNGTQQNDTQYTYDDYDNLTKAVDYCLSDNKMVNVCTSYYRYNKRGMLIAEGQILYDNGSDETESEIEDVLVRYSYDNNGRLTSAEYPADSDGIIAEYYEYNSNNQLTGVKAKLKNSSSTVTLCTYEYTKRGRVKKEESVLSPADANSAKLVKKYTYDCLDRVKTIEYSKGGTVYEKYSYEYDKNSNIIKETTEGAGKEVREYTYTEKGQLSDTAISINGSTQTPYHYEYDSVGNCTRLKHGYIEDMTYNGLNQLVKKTEHTGSEVVTNYTYDKSGNLITSNSSGGNENQYLTYTYDPYNRMISERRNKNLKIYIQSGGRYTS